MTRAAVTRLALARVWLRAAAPLLLLVLSAVSARSESDDKERDGSFKDPAATLIEGIKKAAREGHIGDGHRDFAGWGHRKELEEGYKLDHEPGVAPPPPPAPPPPKTHGFFQHWGGVTRGRTVVAHGAHGATANGKSAVVAVVAAPPPPPTAAAAAAAAAAGSAAKAEAGKEDAARARLERLEKRRREYQEHERKEKAAAAAKSAEVLSAAHKAADALLRRKAAAHALAQERLKALANPPALAPLAQRRALALERLKARKLAADMRRLLADAAGGEPGGGKAGAGGAGGKGKLRQSLGAIEKVARLLNAMRAEAAAGAAHPTAAAVGAAFPAPPAAGVAKAAEAEAAARAVATAPVAAGPPPARDEWLPIPGFKAEKRALLARTPEHAPPPSSPLPALIRHVFD